MCNLRILMGCFLLLSSVSGFAAYDTIAVAGVTVRSVPGKITLINTSGADIPLKNMGLAFDLRQAKIVKVWGNPWLEWLPESLGVAAKYQYTNNNNLPNEVFKAGQKINIEYSPLPWNTTAAPRHVKFYDISRSPLVQANIYATVLIHNWGQANITVINNSNQVLKLNGAELRFILNGTISDKPWGVPYGDWLVTHTGSSYVLKGGANQIAPKGQLTVNFSTSKDPALDAHSVQLWVMGGKSILPSPPLLQKTKRDISKPVAPAPEGTN